MQQNIINLSTAQSGGALMNPLIQTYVNRLRIEFSNVASEYDLIRMQRIIGDHIMPEIKTSDGVLFSMIQKTLYESMLFASCISAGVRIYYARHNGVMLEVPKSAYNVLPKVKK